MISTKTKGGKVAHVFFQDYKTKLHGYFIDREGHIVATSWYSGGRWRKDMETSMDLILEQ